MGRTKSGIRRKLLVPTHTKKKLKEKFEEYVENYLSIYN
jgi:hypothetical protein